ncbi:MAG: glutaredoxin 3 [Gammaproteobacteria bacterium HGW-Gammaproteobacteria-1]|jgi:glutaredoxin 3|nr:MAG: glutaredoxin 3 [Gammaproteobacteria bacterium HGW-Gammaproteobacteria-1]
MPKVEIYSTGSCPYCVRARNLLERKGVAYTEYRVDLKPELRPEMERRAQGCTSVPQIFIDDRHIGGCDDMHALDAGGELDALLK